MSEENEETLRREDAARERLREAVLRALIGVVFRGASVAHAKRVSHRRADASRRRDPPPNLVVAKR